MASSSPAKSSQPTSPPAGAPSPDALFERAVRAFARECRRENVNFEQPCRSDSDVTTHAVILRSGSHERARYRISNGRLRRVPTREVEDKRADALRELGAGGAGGRSGLVYMSTAAEILGITPQALQGIIDPIDEVPNPHYKSGSVSYLYCPLDLLRIRHSAEVDEARARRGRKPKNYRSIFEARYDHRADALKDACEAMFSLNRYAKHGSCSADHRATIYDLKNDLVEHLVGAGYLVGRGQHEIVKPERELVCFRCEGTGEDWDGERVECERWGGSGAYDVLPELVLRFHIFRFDVEGSQYTWHQPDESVTFEIPEVPQLPETEWKPERDQPLNMAWSKLAEAKALVRWVVEGSK